jgi:imidazole glycerol phosphate synthase glutamine amidotransferase subunit
MPTVAVVHTGCANLASVVAALTRIGARHEVTDDASRVAGAAAVVLPGVGHFGPAMRGLRERGIDRAIVHRAEEGLPLLGICLGLQLLCNSSEESADEAGLGVIPGRVTRLPDGVRVPQMGWNRVEPVGGAGILEPCAAYFANSFRLEQLPAGWSGAMSEHGGPFVAALVRGRLLACQFHPELSGRAGLSMLRRWLERSAGLGGTPC